MQNSLTQCNLHEEVVCTESFVFLYDLQARDTLTMCKYQAFLLRPPSAGMVDWLEVIC